jgi:hypothetical protein
MVVDAAARPVGISPLVLPMYCSFSCGKGRRLFRQRRRRKRDIGRQLNLLTFEKPKALKPFECLLAAIKWGIPLSPRRPGGIYYALRDEFMQLLSEFKFKLGDGS